MSCETFSGIELLLRTALDNVYPAISKALFSTSRNARAKRATGVDLSPQAVAHARQAYASLANVEFVEASCTKMPFADASFDLVVSFETLEHIEAQRQFLDEVARVLRPGGVFLLSCPNKLEYSDKRQFANEFHVKELYRDELAALVSAKFPALQWYGQRPSFFSVIAPEGAGAHFNSCASARVSKAPFVERKPCVRALPMDRADPRLS